MNKLFTAAMLLFTAVTFSQTGTIEGTLMDKDAPGEPLPFANVILKGTTKGTTTDFDGNYSIENVPVGDYVVEFSFVGYETLEIPNVSVAADKFTRIDTALGASAAALDEVFITVQTSRERETALLLEQKEATTLKTAIGAEELTRKGVGDVATAVTKVTGISKDDEGSGNVFVRGLGDRYNVTTLNELPLPSNNTSKKNIDLGIFGTTIIETIGIDKTFEVSNYGDFGGANINIVSKDYRGKGFFEVGLKSGGNTEALGQGEFFLNDGPNATGFYTNEIPDFPLANYNFTTSWDREKTSLPVNSGVSLSGGDSYDIGDDGRFNFYGVGLFNNNYVYKDGVNRGGINVGNGLANADFDFLEYSYNTNTTLMANLGLQLGENKIEFNSVYLNTSSQRQQEFDGIIDTEDDAPEGGGFIQRAVFERTSLLINQLLGQHEFGERVELDWGGSYNIVRNSVPNRRQSTLVPLNNDEPEGPKSFRLVSAASDNHRFYQNLDEDEYAARAAASFKFKKNEDDGFDGKVSLGYSGRFKTVDFDATQFNFQILLRDSNNNPLEQPVVDPRNIDSYFNQANLTNGFYQIRTFRGPASFPGALLPQTYGGDQRINAGFLSVEYKFTPKFTVLAGIRGEQINQNIVWNTVINGEGENELDTTEFLPSLSLKYELNEKNNFKFAASKSYTLPQFKERAPFLFQEEINNDSFGNENLTNSTNYNADLRWEFFPTSSELLSVGVFGKYIENPINTVLVNSSANDISYANTGDRATAFGAELEFRKDIFENETDLADDVLKEKLTFGLNASYLRTNQDLSDEKVAAEAPFTVAFTNTEAALSGASDFLFNSDISFYKEFKENRNIRTTVAANYFSDRIFALGSTGRGHLVDKGFVTLDFIAQTELSERISLGLSFKNLLNPEIERVQQNAEGSLNVDSTVIDNFLEDGPVTVLSYKRGLDLSLSLTYRL